MALVSDGYWLHVSLVDNGGNVTRKSYQLKSADETAAIADAATVMTALGNVTDAAFLGYEICLRFVENAFAYPASGVQIENQALIGLGIENNPLKTATTAIPAPKPAIFAGTSGAAANVVDPADAAVLAYWQLFNAAGPCYISDGEVAEVYKDGRRIHRKNTRG